MPPALAHVQPPPLSMSPSEDTFVTTNEPAAWTRHRHPESIAGMRVTLGGVPSAGVDKCVKMCNHHSSVTQSGFTDLNPFMPGLYVTCDQTNT